MSRFGQTFSVLLAKLPESYRSDCSQVKAGLLLVACLGISLLIHTTGMIGVSGLRISMPTPSGKSSFSAWQGETLFEEQTALIQEVTEAPSVKKNASSDTAESSFPESELLESLSRKVEDTTKIDEVGSLPADLLSSSSKPRSLPRVHLFGLAPRATHLVFILDVSGSMLEKSGTETRLSLARKELTAALRGMDSQQTFNVLLYGSRSVSFEKGPIPATPDNIYRAEKFLNSSPDTGGASHMEEALTKAIGMKPDVIMLIADGEPTSTSPQVVLTQTKFLRKRVHKEMRLHAIGYFLKKGSAPELFLQKLASQNNGFYNRWAPKESNKEEKQATEKTRLAQLKE